MFSYVDPTIRQQLVAEGKLWCIDAAGNRCPSNEQGNPFISIVGPVPLPVRLSHGFELYSWFAWVRNAELSRIDEVVQQVREQGPKRLFGLLSNHMAVNSILIYGNFADAELPVVRVHSNCLTGDVFGSMRCDCGPQLQAALSRIVEEGAGALVYMAGHEGRGIGLWAKAITYLLQDAGHDTYQANERLGLPSDSRDFSDAGRILRHFRPERPKLRLLGNNPLKRDDLEKMGIQVVKQEPLVVGVSEFNTRYLESKREHGHLIDADALDSPPSER